MAKAKRPVPNSNTLKPPSTTRLPSSKKQTLSQSNKEAASPSNKKKVKAPSGKKKSAGPPSKKGDASSSTKTQPALVRQGSPVSIPRNITNVQTTKSGPVYSSSSPQVLQNLDPPSEYSETCQTQTETGTAHNTANSPKPSRLLINEEVHTPIPVQEQTSNTLAKSCELALVPTLPISTVIETQFYGALVLLYTLDQIQDHHTKRPSYRGGLEGESSELRRSFIDSLAYICDYKKGGDSVTAIAIQRTCQGIKFWVAANQGVKDIVTDFLRDVLQNLKGASVEYERAIQRSLLPKIVAFNKQRLDFYWMSLQGNLCLCLVRLEEMIQGSESQRQTKTLKALLSWLQKIPQDRVEMVKECFNARNSTIFRTLTQLTANGSPNRDLFDNLRHILGRLGEHVKSSMILVAAAIIFPAIFDDFGIETVVSPPNRPSTTTLAQIQFEEWAATIFSNENEIDHYRAVLANLHTTTHGEIAHRIRDEARFKTRVHAELLLVDTFYWRQFEFFDDDAYIGCSKPACFGCFHYILSHPFNFSLPACHNKLYLTWRPPDILTDAPLAAAAVKLREHMLSKMTTTLRSQLRRQLNGHNPSKKKQFDSTTGTSSSIYAALLQSLTEQDDDNDRESTSSSERPWNQNEGDLNRLKSQSFSESSFDRYSMTDETDDDRNWYEKRLHSLRTVQSSLRFLTQSRSIIAG